MDHLHRLRRHAGTSANRSRRATERLLKHTRRWWQWHRARITDEHGYAAALTAVLLDAVALLTAGPRARYVAHELLAGYVVVLRALRRTRHGDHQA